jgi:hypothetical protein
VVDEADEVQGNEAGSSSEIHIDVPVAMWASATWNNPHISVLILNPRTLITAIPDAALVKNWLV